MRKKEGNKEQDIINAAIVVFAKDGFYKAKVAKIAEEADVSIGSVYVYYKNKDDILYKIFDNLWKNLYNTLKSINDSKRYSINEKYDYMIDIIFDAFTDNPNLAIVIAYEQQQLISKDENKFTEYYKKFIKLGEHILKEGIKKNIFQKNINVPVFRQFLMGAFRELINNWAHSPKEFPLNILRNNIKFITKQGILINKKR